MKHEDYENLRGLCIEEIKIGQEAFISKTITESDIILFSAVTGDNNPVHTSEEFAKKTIFKKRVGHGFLTASLISTVIGTKLPGPGSIYLNQSLSFLAPVFIGETVIVRVSVRSKDEEKNRVKLDTFCEKDGKKILKGEAEILVMSKKT
ncbi:MaoC family dehydratase [Rickettsiales bacterium]|nr:MaoC family dehydratase [Rickettsiales bacterium]